MPRFQHLGLFFPGAVPYLAPEGTGSRPDPNRKETG